MSSQGIVGWIAATFATAGALWAIRDEARRDMIVTFGPVKILAYTPYDPGNKWMDGHVATGKLILRTDYSVAVSKDIENWVKGISNAKMIHIPSYNKVNEWSMINDRSDQPSRTIEVLMTGRRARQRAKAWGVKHGILKGMKTPGGIVYWVEGLQ